jgi:putative ABC transport system substrate-binding protein
MNAKKTRKSYYFNFICIFFALLTIYIWIFWIAPEFKKIPDNFSYSANILSLDDFYNEQSKEFEGKHVSKTTFTYKVLSKTSSYLIINNSFEVSKLSGQPIFSVSRLYYVNPYDGRHVNIRGKPKRSGYLYAPHYAKREPFNYWHINYNAPALMKFVNVESIYGLKVYHYQARYEADQTADLTYLPEVPEKRGIRTEINLQLWIEPISGWLIKYQDNTIAYFYDKKTGVKIAPWNRFSNRYTQNSIQKKVEQAKQIKRRYLWVDYGAPVLIIIITLLVMYFAILKQLFRQVISSITTFYTKKKGVIYYGIIILLFIGVALGTIYYFFSSQKPPSFYKIGISRWNDNSELVAAIQGFKDGLAEFGFYEGKNISFIIKNPDSNVEKQIKIIQSFVEEKMNIIFTLTTQGTLVAKGITTSIPIVFSDVSYPNQTGIINESQLNKTNLIGSLNYISPAEQFYQFDIAFPNTKKIGFIHHKGDPDSEIQYQEYKSMLNKRNIEVIDIPAININDMQKQLQKQLNQHQFNALFVACDTLIRDKGYKVAAEFGKQYKIPTLSCDKNSIMNGVMIGYFADLYSTGKLAGIKAALILLGAEPGWLKNESPKKGYLMINLITAQLLGIKISDTQLKKADVLIKH